MSECDAESSVPDWLIEHPETFPVFTELGLDCTCGGRSLRFLCEQNDWNVNMVVAALRRAISNHGAVKSPDPISDSVPNMACEYPNNQDSFKGPDHGH